jgi:type II secretion system protein G
MSQVYQDELTFDLPQQRGFTLVELMVVVAIIALIATIIIPNFIHARQQADVSTSEANLKQIATGLELYLGDFDIYPAGSDLKVTPANLYKSTNNAYMQQTPIDPVDGQDYIYTNTSVTGGADYTLEAPGTYDSVALTNVGNCPTGVGSSAGDTQLWYSPQSGICKN